jgi:hypothetical protein
MRFKEATTWILILFTVYLSKPAWADIYTEQEVTTDYLVAGEKISKTTHQRLYLRKNMLKIEEVESGETTIVRLDDKLVFKFNPTDKTYTQSDFQTIKLQSSQEEISARQRQPQMEMGQEAVRRKMMETMPPEQRSIMEEMMRIQMSRMRGALTVGAAATTVSGPAELKLTTDTKTILGHLVKRLKVVQTVRGKRKKIIELWVTTEIEPKNYVADFIEALGLFHSEVIEQLKKVEGFPLQMKYRIQSGPLAGNLQTVKVTKLEERPLPIQEFEVLTGYKPTIAPVAAPMAEEEESF